MIEAGEFRKNLGITNNQSTQIERRMIAIIMKVFVKENMVRQYQITGKSTRWLCWFMFCQSYHKLIIEIDEDDYLYYGNDEIRQK